MVILTAHVASTNAKSFSTIAPLLIAASGSCNNKGTSPSVMVLCENLPRPSKQMLYFAATVILDELALIGKDYLANGGRRVHVPCYACVAMSSGNIDDGQRLHGGMGNSVQTYFSKLDVQGSWLTLQLSLCSGRVGGSCHNLTAKSPTSGDFHRN
jgi:hypothetical protein